MENIACKNCLTYIACKNKIPSKYRYLQYTSMTYLSERCSILEQWLSDRSSCYTVSNNHKESADMFWRLFNE